MAKKRLNVVVEVSQGHLKIVLLNASSGKLFSAVIKDISSLDKKEKRKLYIVDILKNVLHGHLSDITSAMLCLSDTPAVVKRIELPYMSINEIAGALKWKIKETAPFDIEKAVLDFDIIGETQDEEGAKKYSIITTAVPKDIIDENIVLLKEGGLNIIEGVNTDSFGLSNIISLVPEGKRDAICAILKVGDKISTVNIYKGSKLTFVREIPVGLGSIKECIKGPVVSDGGETELKSEDIEELRKIGIPSNEDILLNGRLQGKHILVLIRPVLENLCNEIKRSFDYYNIQLESGKVSKLYLMGDSLRYKNLDGFIKEALNIDAEYLGLSADLFSAIAEKETGETKEIVPQVISLIGVGRGGAAAKVNLLPAEYKMAKVQSIQKISIRMIGFTVLAVLIASFILVKTRIDTYKRKLETAKGRIEVLHEVKVLYDKVLEREEFVRKVRSAEVPGISILKELSNIIPSNIVLDNLVIDQRSGIIRFDGIVYLDSGIGEVILAGLMESLERSPLFKDVNLESSQKRDIDGKEVSKFYIDCLIQK